MANVSLINIANNLGCDADVAAVCTSSAINKWSFYKPVNSESIKQLENRDFYDSNDGFYLFTFNNPSRMVYELQNPNVSNIWSYEDREAPFRLTDFERYGAMTLDFSLSWTNTNSGVAGDVLRLEYNFDMLSLLEWKYFEGVRSYVDVVLLVYPQGTQFDSSGATSLWVYKVSSILDFDAGNNRINLRLSNDLSGGAYEVRLCFSTATSSLSDGEWRYVSGTNPLVGVWYAMPELSKNIFYVTSSPGPSPTDFFDWVDFDSFPACWFDFYSPYIYSLAFKNRVDLLDTTRELSVYITYSYTNVRSGELALGSYSFPLDTNNLYKINEINHPDEIEVIADARLEEDIINIQMSASITDKSTGISQTRTWTKNVERI